MEKLRGVVVAVMKSEKSQITKVIRESVPVNVVEFHLTDKAAEQSKKEGLPSKVEIHLCNETSKMLEDIPVEGLPESELSVQTKKDEKTTPEIEIPEKMSDEKIPAEKKSPDVKNLQETSTEEEEKKQEKSADGKLSDGRPSVLKTDAGVDWVGETAKVVGLGQGAATVVAVARSLYTDGFTKTLNKMAGKLTLDDSKLDKILMSTKNTQKQMSHMCKVLGVEIPPNGNNGSEKKEDEKKEDKDGKDKNGKTNGGNGDDDISPTDLI